MHKLSLLLLASNLAFPCIAQTGRIALSSHSGSVATLVTEEAKDNFGTLMPYFQEDSLVYISDSKVLVYGRWRYCSDCKDRKNPSILTLHPKMNAAAAARYFRQNYGRVPKLVGFDSTAKQVNQGRRKLKRNGKEKPVDHSHAFSKRPFQYSYWRGLAGVAALGAVGWLLGKKRAA